MTNDNKDIKQELEDLSSSLARHRKLEAKAPPEGYFERMQDAVLMSVQSEEISVEPQNMARRLYLSPWLGRIAAGLILLFAVGFGIWMNGETKEVDYFAQLSDDEMYSYVIEHASDYDLWSDLNGMDLSTEVDIESADDDMLYDELLYDLELDEFL